MPQTTGINTLTIGQARIDQIIGLRHAELRTGMPPESARFEGDDAPTTFHFGAFCDGVNIGCASFMLNSYNGQPAYQLRGMATRRDLARRGVGRLLLAMAEQTILAQTVIRQFWCNARQPAVGFYQKQGWVIDSDLFEIPTAGPHFRMKKSFEAKE